jgi:hypothetical protein
VIAAEKATYGVGRMAELLGVSRTGFYSWLKRGDGVPGPRAARRAELTEKIIDFHTASNGVNGPTSPHRQCRPCSCRSCPAHPRS